MKVHEFRNLIREEIRKTIKEVESNSNATYKVDIITSDFTPEEVEAVSGDPMMIAKALKDSALEGLGPDDFDAEFIKAHKLDNDTYIVSTSEETVTVVGKPSSKTYGEFWSMLQSGDVGGAEKMWNRMEMASLKAQEIDQTQEPYALVIDERGRFKKVDLRSYSGQSELDNKGVKLTAEKAFNYAVETEATTSIPDLQKWMKSVELLQTGYDFYDVTAGGGEGVVVAAIPAGSKLKNFIVIPDDEDDAPGGAIQNLFSSYARQLPATFNIKTFATKVGLSPEDAEKALLKLEPSDTLPPQLVSKIMDDIISGKYDSFKQNLPKIVKAKKIATKKAARKYFR